MTRIPIALALLLVLLAGCGGSSSSSSSKPVDPNAKESSPAGDIPDNQAFVAFSPPGADYSVKVPEGWAQTARGAAVTLTDKLNSIRMEERAPVAARTELPRLKQTVKGFQSPKLSIVKRSSARAVRIAYLADAQADPVTQRTGTNAVERYLFSHNGKQVVLTLSGPKGADNVDPWRLVTDSLRWAR